MKCPTCGEETERIINICDTKIKVKVMCSCKIKEQEEKKLQQTLLDIKNKSYGYKRLLSEQYSYINKPDNKQKIIDKAEKIYNIIQKIE